MTDIEVSEVLKALFDMIYKFMNKSMLRAFGKDFTLWQLFLVGMLIGFLFWAWHEFSD